MEFILEHHDDPDFVRLVQDVVAGAAHRHRPTEVLVVHIDNWFGDRWVRFAGKMFGAAGVRKPRATVPPFHPHRVRSEQRFVREAATSVYESARATRRLHRYQHSGENLQRYADLQTASGMFAWYSGNTLQNAVGSLMVYLVENDEAKCWYALLEKRGEWVCRKSVGISIERLMEYADGQPVQ